VRPTILHFVLVTALAATGLTSAVTGITLRFLLPRLGPGRREVPAGRPGTLRDQYRDVHARANMALLGLVLVHLALNWEWVVQTFGTLVGKRRTAD